MKLGQLENEGLRGYVNTIIDLLSKLYFFLLFFFLETNHRVDQ